MKACYPEPALLDDPDYEPKHPPQNGLVPAVVTRWGPRSQIRWFTRFRRALIRRQPWAQWHTESLLHRGDCCMQCGDWESPSDYWDDPDSCCCRGYDKAKELSS